MDDTVILVAKWALCSGVGCLLGMWLQGKLSALWGAIRRDRDCIAQLWERNAEDRKMIGDLQKRVVELEAKFITTNVNVAEPESTKYRSFYDPNDDDLWRFSTVANTEEQ
jgi:hypothetical protein